MPRGSPRSWWRARPPPATRLRASLWDDALRYLGAALANYVTLLNPELLVLGGGVMLTVPSLAEALTERVRGTPP